LSIEQYNALLAAAPLLESVMSKRDVQVTRPDYDTDPNTAEAAQGGTEEQYPADEDKDE